MLLANKVVGTVGYLGGIMTVPESFCWAWGQLVQYCNEYAVEPGQLIHWDHATVSYHSFARNQLVARFLGEWLLMLDTDHIFEPNIVVRLLHRMQTYNLDVVTGIYQYKGPPYSPVLYTWDDKQENFLPLGAWDPEQPLFQVAAAGAGCLLVRRSVFDRIKTELHEGPFDIIPPCSEDLSFFKRLQRLGIPVFCDSRIEVNHLHLQPITLEDYDTRTIELAERQVVEGYR